MSRWNSVRGLFSPFPSSCTWDTPPLCLGPCCSDIVYNKRVLLIDTCCKLKAVCLRTKGTRLRQTLRQSHRPFARNKPSSRSPFCMDQSIHSKLRWKMIDRDRPRRRVCTLHVRLPPPFYSHTRKRMLSPPLALWGSLIVIHTVCSTDTSTRISYLPTHIRLGRGHSVRTEINPLSYSRSVDMSPVLLSHQTSTLSNHPSYTLTITLLRPILNCECPAHVQHTRRTQHSVVGTFE